MRYPSILRAGTWLVAVCAVALAACDQLPTEQARSNGPDADLQLSSHQLTCQATGTGLTARVVNQSLNGGTIDIGDCDVGAYFNQDGSVRGVTFVQDDDDGAPSRQYAVLVEGAKVNVTRSAVTNIDDFAHQFLGIAYRDGATGKVSDNTITGFHRVGILARGAGTSVQIRGNEVTGVGPKSTGWAENGIQVSNGASATVAENAVRDHWWNLNTFISSGIIIFASDDVMIQRNALSGNDGGIVLVGDRNSVKHNEIDSTIPSGGAADIIHVGIFVAFGTDNSVNQNLITSSSPSGSSNFGIFVSSSATNTKLIGNEVSGFAFNIVDAGDETKLPKPFEN